jgi:hypothetical protein
VPPFLGWSRNLVSSSRLWRRWHNKRYPLGELLRFIFYLSSCKPISPSIFPAMCWGVLQ